MVSGKTLPYLKDALPNYNSNYPNDVWNNWQVQDRDLYIINIDKSWIKISLNSGSNDVIADSIKILVDSLITIK
tara:strand:- start:241 stop:462 length:222 start_codon:yes stop_codon:yes gene_type:complete